MKRQRGEAENLLFEADLVLFPDNWTQRGDDVNLHHDQRYFLGSKAIRLRRLERIYIWTSGLSLRVIG